MSIDTSQDNAAPLPEPENIGTEGGVPPGIARLRKEWKAAGFSGEPQTHEDADADVVFPETDGGAGVGDYSLEYSEVKSMLALSDDAMRRLILTIGLDSIRVKSGDGTVRRLFSRSSVKRFQEDTAIETDALLESAAQVAERSSMTEAVDDLRSEVAELRGTQSKILQQMKDILLLEVRNLKEQERDLASFVYELAEELRSKKGSK